MLEDSVIADESGVFVMLELGVPYVGNFLSVGLAYRMQSFHL